MSAGSRFAKRIVIEGAGWILVVVGLAAMVLPGPGLLALFAGVALLSSQYEWARKRLEPVKKAAMRTAADSVSSVSRIAFSVVLVLGLIATGVVWGVHPPAPSWWPLNDRWWLLGGWGTGVSLILSGLIALGTIIYSYLNFRDRPGGADPSDTVRSDDREPSPAPDRCARSRRARAMQRRAHRSAARKPVGMPRRRCPGPRAPADHLTCGHVF